MLGAHIFYKKNDVFFIGEVEDQMLISPLSVPTNEEIAVQRKGFSRPSSGVSQAFF